MKKYTGIIIDKEKNMLGCTECAQRWVANLMSGGRQHRNYRQCPNGCEPNEPVTDNIQDKPVLHLNN